MTNCLPCFCCEKEISPVFTRENNSSDINQQPDDAIGFVSNGNYGSTVFDPMEFSVIAINICDDCIKSKMEKSHFITITTYENGTKDNKVVKYFTAES